MASKDYKHCWGEGTPWATESAWMNWLRGSIRRVWSKHPLKIAALHKHRIRIENPKVASRKAHPTIWGGECQVCKGLFPLSAGKKEGGGRGPCIQVDHKLPAGTFKDIKDFQGFFERMFCVGIDDLQLVCSDCNKLLAYADKYKVSLDMAKSVKEALNIVKEKRDKAWLIENGVSPASAQANRRKQIVEKLMEGKT